MRKRERVAVWIRGRRAREHQIVVNLNFHYIISNIWQARKIKWIITSCARYWDCFFIAFRIYSSIYIWCYNIWDRASLCDQFTISFFLSSLFASHLNSVAMRLARPLFLFFWQVLFNLRNFNDFSSLICTIYCLFRFSFVMRSRRFHTSSS